MDQLTYEIYSQLLELYIYDLENEECPSVEAKYSDDYDAWYDPEKNVWLDDKCSDPTCKYCANRPERPL